jgi:WD40 repeat protein
VPALTDVPPALAAVVARMTAKDPSDRYATPAEVAAALSPFALPSPHLRGRGIGGEGAGAGRKRRRLLAAALVLLATGIVAAGIIVLRLQTDRGDIVIQVDDSSLEIVTKKGGEIVRIRDPKTGQTWELDARKLTIRDLEHPDGFEIELPGRGRVTFRSGGGKVVVMAGPPEFPADTQSPGFQPLFNGRDLDGWDTSYPPIKDHWKVIDGALIGSAKEGETGSAKEGETVLIGRTKWTDFHLRAVVRVKGPGKSGINFRANAYQAQIGETGTGNIARILPSKWLSLKEHSLVKPETWFRLELIADGPKITAKVNGQVLAEVSDSTHAEGFGFLRLVLDARDGPVVVEFRSIEIKDLTPTAPIRRPDPAELAKLANAADGLKQADIPKDALAYIGGGDPDNVPPELVAVLGDTRFRCFDGPGPMAFSPDGKQVAVANGRNEIRFLEVATGRLLRQITSPYTPRSRMAFSPNGRYLVGTRVGGEFNVIDAETGRRVWKREPIPRSEGVDNFAFSPDGKTVYVSHAGYKEPKGWVWGSLEQRDADTGTLKNSWVWEDPLLRDFALSPDGTKSVEVTGDSKLRIRDLSTPTGRVQRFELHGSGERVAFSPDGKRFAVARSGEGDYGKVTLHDGKGDVIHTLPERGEGLLAFTPDGKTLVPVSQGGRAVSRWSVADGKKLSSAELAYAHASAPIVLSPDGKTLARRWGDSFQIGLYDTETGKPRYSRTGHQGSITALAFSHDGKYLASSDRYRTRLWDLATAREIAVWGEGPSHRLAFSPDGTLLALAGTTSIGVHRVPDGAQLHVLKPRRTGSNPSPLVPTARSSPEYVATTRSAFGVFQMGKTFASSATPETSCG